jgi:hypothetical protein
MKWLSVVFAMLMVSVVLAHGETEALVNKSQGKDLPGSIASIFANERINIYVKEGAGTENYGVVTKDKKIIEAKVGLLENPTMNVYTDAETLDLLLNSGSEEALLKAFDEKKITYEGVGVVSSIKLFFVSIGIWLAGLF